MCSDVYTVNLGTLIRCVYQQRHFLAVEISMANRKMRIHRYVAVAIIFVHVIDCGVVDKPGFDRFAQQSVTSIKHSKEADQHTQLHDAIQFVQQQSHKFNALNRNEAKNVILFLGDGMSVPVLAATRVYLGSEKESLSFEKFPFVAMSKTYCIDQKVADSACSSTGMIFL